MGCTPSRPCSSTGASNQRKSSSSVSLTTVVPTVANQGAESSHHVTNSSQSHSVLVKDNNQINAVPSTLHIVTLPSANNQSGHIFLSSDHSSVAYLNLKSILNSAESDVSIKFTPTLH